MKEGLTYNQANEAWKKNADVICPGCETHIHEEDAIVYFGEIWHYVCKKADQRINNYEDAEAAIYGD